MKISEINDNNEAAAAAAGAEVDFSGLGSLGQVAAVLRRGSRGDAVKQLQQLLAARGYPMQVDGIFGPGTEAAVKAVQEKLRLTVDGVWGPQTNAAFMAAGSQPVAQATPADKQAVANAVENATVPSTATALAPSSAPPDAVAQPMPQTMGEKFQQLLKSPWYWVGVGAVVVGIWWMWSSKPATAQVSAVETLALDDGLDGMPKPKRKRKKRKAKKAAPKSEE